MKHTYLLLALALCLLPATTQAQKRKSQPKKGVVKKTPERPLLNPVFAEMLPATQQVVFVDSVVVDSATFLRAIATNPEEGSVRSYNDFFGTGQQPKGYVYINELGNKCYYSMADASGHTMLYTSDLLGNEWSEPERLQGLEGEGLFNYNYPFLMPDGQTLYFAACGGEGVGSYDIYRTRFDAESGRYLKPENIGLPFNSEAQDYMFVVSEQDSIGFFATNRRQPAGKVCIYSFVTTDSRCIYNAETIGESRLLSLARLDRIADTWSNGAEPKGARARLAQLRSRQGRGAVAAAQQEFVFVVDDQRTYTRLADFRNADNADRMRELLSMQQQAKVLQTALDKARAYFANASAAERADLRSEILQSEQQLEALQMQMQQTEKEIRNHEINN